MGRLLDDIDLCIVSLKFHMTGTIVYIVYIDQKQ